MANRVRLLGLLLLALSAGTANAVNGPNGLPPPIAPLAARSLSGQFHVYGEPAIAVGPGRVPRLDASDARVQLKADWLAVGAERVKQAVLREFGATDRWRGRIHLYVSPRARLGEAPIRIVPVPFRDGWQYRVDLPDEIEWPRLVRALVEAVLLEATNREAGDRAAQPPLWLSEGVTAIVIAQYGRDLIPQGQTTVTHSERRPNLLAEARIRLKGGAPLLFGELSFPSDEILRGTESWSRYQGSAMLLTHELMADDSGRAAMRETLHRLPGVLNWQTAFLQANSGRFQSLLEVEKWWAVNTTHVLARDPALLWSRDVALTHLTALVHEPAEMPGATNGLAVRRDVSLATIVRDWDYSVQRPVLVRKLAQLRQLYQFAPADLVPLVTEYHQTLSAYLDTRQGFATDPLRRSELEPRTKLVVRQAARRFEELDARLARGRAAR